MKGKGIKLTVFIVFAVCAVSMFYGLRNGGNEKDLGINENDLKRLVQKYPLDPESYYNLGKFYSGKNETEKAQALLKSALKLNKFDLKYMLALADLLKNAGKQTEALNYYNQALSIQANIGSAWTSDIYLSIAQIYLERKETDKFLAYVSQSREIFKGNWRADFLMFRHKLFESGTAHAFEYFVKSWEIVKSTLPKRPEYLEEFEAQFHLTAREILRRGDFENLKAVYDRYASLSNGHEKLLVDLNERFRKFPELRKKIWGDKIFITLFDPKLNERPVLENMSKGCAIESKKQYVESGTPAVEKLEIKYASSPSYLDLWFIPLNIPVKSPKTSVSISLSSDSVIDERQITVELLNDLYYTKGSLQKDGNRYVLTTKNILSYVEKYLPLVEKDYTITLTKLGINTVCRNGNYGILKMEIYLED